MDLDLRDRDAHFRALGATTFDLLVIGGGISGCGIARDAAMRGLHTALVEADDLGSGTSSRSSKLIHGGLHYLVRGEIAIAREAVNERAVLHRIAPHLAVRTPVILRVRSWLERTKLRAALTGYERLGRVAAGDRHQVWDLSRLTGEEPAIAPDGLIGAVVYPEYLTDDARLTVANARSAAGHGALVATHTSVVRLCREGGRMVGAEVVGNLDGEDRRALVRARLVVNAAGPWVDEVRRLEEDGAPARLLLSKGIHVTLPRTQLPIRHVVVMNSPDGRVVFAVPRGACVYLGTTDVPHPRPDRWPPITLEEVSYLLESAARTFRDCRPRPQDVLSAWSGIRALVDPRGPGGPRGQRHDLGHVSRRAEAFVSPSGVVVVAGGKLTSYRALAERVVDRAETCLDRRRAPCRTADEPLPGGDLSVSLDELTVRLERAGLDAPLAERYARLYGGEADAVLPDGDAISGEVRQAVRREGALTLADYWFRRSGRAFFDEHRDGSLEAASQAMQGLMGWSEPTRLAEVERCRQLCRRSLEAIAAT